MTNQKPKKEQPAPIPFRPNEGSKIKEYLAKIQEIDPGSTVNGIINEALEKYLPKIIEQKKEELKRRYERVFGQDSST